MKAMPEGINLHVFHLFLSTPASGILIRNVACRCCFCFVPVDLCGRYVAKSLVKCVWIKRANDKQFACSPPFFRCADFGGRHSDRKHRQNDEACSIVSTQIYAQITDQKISRDMDRLIQHKEYVGLVWKRTCFGLIKQVLFHLIVVAVLLNVLKLAHHEKCREQTKYSKNNTDYCP